MIISLENISKRFNYEWIFRDVNFAFDENDRCAIIGPNGSGKSTLLKVIAGQLTPSSGNIIYSDKQEIPQENVYQMVSYAAPYLELIEEFTLSEMVQFHFSFKKWKSGLNLQAIISLSGLEKHKHKQLRTFSSGMRQRVKLVLALCAETPLVILDEPTTNLDESGVEWYLHLIRDFGVGRIILVGSNQEREYTFCSKSLNILDFKG